MTIRRLAAAAVLALTLAGTAALPASAYSYAHTGWITYNSRVTLQRCPIYSDTSSLGNKGKLWAETTETTPCPGMVRAGIRYKMTSKGGTIREYGPYGASYSNIGSVYIVTGHQSTYRY